MNVREMIDYLSNYHDETIVVADKYGYNDYWVEANAHYDPPSDHIRIEAQGLDGDYEI